MTKNIRIGVGLIASITFLLAAAAWAHTAGVFAAPTAVAIVDIDALQDGLEEQKDLGRMLQAKYKPMNDDIVRIEAEIQSLVKKLKDEEATMTEEELRALNIEGLLLEQRKNSTKEIRAQSQLVEVHAIMQGFYPKIYDAIARVAERGGWDVVLLDTSKIDPSAPFPNIPAVDKFAAMNDAVSRKHVLYVNPNVDITNEVLLLLNNEYANRQAAPPPEIP